MSSSAHQYVPIMRVFQRKVTSEKKKKFINISICTDKTEKTMQTQIKCCRMQLQIKVYTVIQQPVLDTSSGIWTKRFVQILGAVCLEHSSIHV